MSIKYNKILMFLMILIIGCDALISSETEINENLMIPVGNCGDCVLQEYEECDYCIYFDNKGDSVCLSENLGYGTCNILMNSFRIITKYPLSEMNTPEFDQEEADLFCKIRYRNDNYISTAYKISSELKFPMGAIIPLNENLKGNLLKTAKDFYDENLYYFKYEDIPVELLNSSFMSINCKII